MPTLAVTTAHAFVLTVSHGLLFRRPPFTATARLPPLLSNSPHSIARRTRRSKSPLLVSDLDSSANVTSSINYTSSAMLPVEFQHSSWRTPNDQARTREVSRSEHDLNLAILYAVHSGFRYSASLFLPDLRCRPLGEIMLRASGQRGALIRGRFREPQTNRFQPIFQVLFYPPACLPDLQSRPAMLCVIARTEHSLQSRRVVRR